MTLELASKPTLVFCNDRVNLPFQFGDKINGYSLASEWGVEFLKDIANITDINNFLRKFDFKQCFVPKDYITDTKLGEDLVLRLNECEDIQRFMIPKRFSSCFNNWQKSFERQTSDNSTSRSFVYRNSLLLSNLNHTEYYDISVDYLISIFDDHIVLNSLTPRIGKYSKTK